MAWTTPQYSKAQVDEAGRVVVEDDLEPDATVDEVMIKRFAAIDAKLRRFRRLRLSQIQEYRRLSGGSKIRQRCQGGRGSNPKQPATPHASSP
jgi:hypothetical protein